MENSHYTVEVFRLLLWGQTRTKAHSWHPAQTSRDSWTKKNVDAKKQKQNTFKKKNILKISNQEPFACTHAVIHLTLISTCQITRTTSAQSYFSLDTRTYNRNTLYCLFIYFIFSSAACLQRFHRILYGGRHYLCIWLFGQLFIYWIINSSSWLTIPLFMI